MSKADNSLLIKRLFSAWPMQASALRPEQTGLYLEKANEFAAIDVLAAISDYENGAVPDQDPKWMPSVPEFVTYVRKKADERGHREWLAKNAPRIAGPSKGSEPKPDYTAERRAATIARLKAECGGVLIRTTSALDREDLAEHRRKRDAFILAVHDGDQAALAAWKAEAQAAGGILPAAQDDGA